MMLEKSNAPAFPKSHDPYPNCQETTDTSVYLGLTKREYFAGKAMIDAPQFVRAFNHLETSIFPGGRRDSHHDRNELVRKHELVFIPVAVVLVPFPGAAHFGFLFHQFTVIMTNRSAGIQQAGYPLYQPAASGKTAVKVIAGSVPE